MRIAMSGVLALILALAVLLLFFGRPPAPSTIFVASRKSKNPQTPPPAPGPEPLRDQPSAPPDPSSPHGADTEARVTWTKVEERILELTNLERSKVGMKPLEREDGLCITARSQSADMIARHFFDHVNPSGESPSDRIERMNRRLVGEAGENIWEGTGPSFVSNPDLGATIVRAWMNSPHHKANILRPTFNRLGVGVTIVGDEVRATQNFSEEKAYLAAPLPATMTYGSQVDLTIAPGSPAAEMFDLEPVDEHPGKPEEHQRKPHKMPVAHARIAAGSGRYRLRLYFPEGKPGAFAIYDGPQLTVTAPSPAEVTK